MASAMISIPVPELRSAFTCRFAGDGAEAACEEALGCLEELRLLVPLACGECFHEAPPAAIAPYCLKHQSRDHRQSFAAVTLLACEGLGRHWSCEGVQEPAQARLSLAAAAHVAREAGLGAGGQGELLRCILPQGLVAPSFWVDAEGHPNAPLLRFVTLKLLRHLSRTPGLSVNKLAQQGALVDPCEIEFLLDRLCVLGAVEACPQRLGRGNTPDIPVLGVGSETLYFASSLVVPP